MSLTPNIPPPRSRSAPSPGTRFAGLPRSSAMYLLLTLAACGLCGLLALFLGQDANWDLRNYHFYNPYAFLNGRMDFDVAPAQVATYYNPLLYIPFFHAVQLLPPRWLGFLLGAEQGLNFAMLFGLARHLLAAEQQRMRTWLCALVALLGILGAGNLSELGTSFGDNFLSLFFLGGLWLMAANLEGLRDLSLRSVGITMAAGLLCGLAAGLKQPFAIYCVGMCLAFFTIPTRLSFRAVLAFCFGIGVVVGLTATSGFWLYELWRRFGNPLFPYFNQIFHSPMASVADYRDPRFLPHSMADALLYPCYFAFAPLRTAEVPFRDCRLLLLFLLLTLFGVQKLLPKATSVADTEAAMGSRPLSAPASFYLATIVFSFAAWLKLFGIYRYLVPLELLAPAGIMTLSRELLERPQTRKVLTAGLVLVILATTVPANWGRIAWGEHYFGVTLPKLAEPDKTMVLMTGLEPTAYLIPFFPPQVRFLRIQSYFTGPSTTPNGSDRLMQDLVTSHSGPLFVLYRAYEAKQTREALKAYGLAMEESTCQAMSPHIDANMKAPLEFCAVHRFGG